MKKYRPTLLVAAVLTLQTALPALTLDVKLPLGPADTAGREFVRHPGIMRPRIGLALSGGGARGFAHIGVLKVFEKENIPVDRIVGTSMGSVVAGLYAAGFRAAQIESLALAQNWREIFANSPQRTSMFVTQKSEYPGNFAEFGLDRGRPVLPTALTAGQRLVQVLTELTLEADYEARGDFDRLPIPYRAVSTDMVTGRKFVLSKGPLAQAMRASIAVPFAMTPVSTDSMLLFDGGMADNLPSDVVRDLGADFVIGVDVKAPLRKKQELGNALEILDQIVTLTILLHSKQGEDSSDLLIVPELGGHLSSDFSHIEKLIEAGERSALAALPALRRKLEAVQFPPPVVPEKPICQIRFTSCPDTASRYFSIKPGQVLSGVRLHAALAQLYESGYFSAVSAQVESRGDSLVLVVSALEYPRWRRCRIRGSTVFTAGELESLFTFKPGAMLNWKDYENCKRRLIEKYRQAGCILAAIDQVENLGDEFRITVDEGTVNAVSVAGNERTRDEVVLRELGIRTGQVFRLGDARQSIAQIYSTNLFDQVILQVQPGISLLAQVQEKKPDCVQLGLRYDDFRLGEGFIRYIRQNLRGGGNRWVTHAQYGLRREKYSSFILGDRLGGTYLFHKAGVYLYKDKKQMVDEDQPNRITLRNLRKIGLSFSLGRQIRRLGQVSAILRTENFLSDSLDQQWWEADLQQYSQGIRTISLQSNVDDLDKVPFPTSGKKHHFALDFAHDVIGGTERYFSGLASVSAYYTVGGDHTFYPRMQVAYSDKALPSVEKHFIGGYRSMALQDDIAFYNDFCFLGYEEQAFFGDCMLVLNLQYRWRVLPWTYVFFEYDVGQSWQRKDVSLTWGFLPDQLRGLKQGFGLGLSFDSPMGPLTMVGAQAFNPMSEAERKTEQNFYLSLGHDF